MKKSRFTEVQIMSVLKQAEAGISAVELCRQHAISNATFYKWRTKYGGMDASMIAETKAVQEENRRLKICRTQHSERASERGPRKKIVKPSDRRRMAEKAVA
jgi:putative transposase